MEAPTNSQAIKKKRTRGKAIKWAEERRYETEAQYLEDRKLLSKAFNANNLEKAKDGTKSQIFVCKRARSAGYNCPAKVKITENDALGIIRYTNNLAHDHEIKEARQNLKFSEQAEDKLEELVNVDLNRRKIRTEVKRVAGQDLTNEQLNNKITYIRKKMNKGNAKITVAELNAFVAENEKIPENDDEAFIVKTIWQEENEENLRFAIIVSTRNLLRKLEGRYILHFDSTYNTNVEKKPLLLFGCSKVNKPFELIGTVLMSSEDEEGISSVLQFIKDTAVSEPIATMTDGDRAFTAAVNKIFPDTTRLMCWYHVVKNLQDHLKTIKSMDVKLGNQLFEDIKQVRKFALDEEMFNLLMGLLNRKYTEEIPPQNDEMRSAINGFFIYKSKTWELSKEKNWYQAQNPQSFTTNNSVEALNSVFKRDYTERKSLSVPNLMVSFFK